MSGVDVSDGEVTHTMRDGLPAFRLVTSSCVKYQCPKWLVPLVICRDDKGRSDKFIYVCAADI